MSYFTIKNIHMMMAVLTISGFFVRSVWAVLGSKLLQHRLVKVLPHFIDTVLFLSGLIMVYLAKIYQHWLVYKLILVVGYILCGFWVLRWAKSQWQQGMGLLLAIACLAAIIFLAHYKPF